MCFDCNKENMLFFYLFIYQSEYAVLLILQLECVFLSKLSLKVCYIVVYIAINDCLMDGLFLLLHHYIYSIVTNNFRMIFTSAILSFPLGYGILEQLELYVTLSCLVPCSVSSCLKIFLN